jgi:hypothetical protein
MNDALCMKVVLKCTCAHVHTFRVMVKRIDKGTGNTHLYIKCISKSYVPMWYVSVMLYVHT